MGGVTVVTAVEQRVRASRGGRPEPVQHRRLLSTHTIREIRHWDLYREACCVPFFSCFGDPPFDREMNGGKVGGRRTSSSSRLT